MWKKNEATAEGASTPSPTPRPRETTSRTGAEAAVSNPTPSLVATIGPSISIKGDISGNEDLVIEGKVEGAIELGKHNVTIGHNGRVTADIRGKRICVEGEVKGDLLGDEVLIRKSGRVEGNAKAPRVTLENGCNFRGSIDMKPAGSPSTSQHQSRRGSTRSKAAAAAL